LQFNLLHHDSTDVRSARRAVVQPVARRTGKSWNCRLSSWTTIARMTRIAPRHSRLHSPAA